MNEKPDGAWQCRACRKVWHGSELYQEPGVTRVLWTCGDLFCGGVVDDVTATETGILFSGQVTQTVSWHIARKGVRKTWIKIG